MDFLISTILISFISLYDMQELPSCSTSHYPEVIYLQTNFGSEAMGNSGDVYM